MPKDVETSTAEFPPDLRQFPEIAARELYIHRVVGRGAASIFFREYEWKRKEAFLQRHEGAATVAFRFPDVIYFIAAAAAQGVIGNLTYRAVASVVRAIRRPGHELGGGRSAKFEFIISKKTYERLRKERHSGERAKKPSSVFTRKVTRTYSLMVTRTDKPLCPRKKSKKTDWLWLARVDERRKI